MCEAFAGRSKALCGRQPVTLSLLGPTTEELTRQDESETAITSLKLLHVELDPRPMSRNLPPLVIDSSALTLKGLCESSFLPSADLPPACQVCFALSHSG
jgi:hypothetical protein